MITIIITLLVTIASIWILILLYWMWWDGYEFEKILWTIIWLSIIFLCNMCMYVNFYTDTSKTTSLNIVSLERWQEVSWTFVLWFGWVSTSIVYYAYTEIGQNEYVLAKKSSDQHWQIIIKETNKESPKFKTVRQCNKIDVWYKCNTKNYIIVPKWTIRKQFNW